MDKSQILKIAIPLGILLVVLLFNGNIKKSLSSLRTNDAGSSTSRSKKKGAAFSLAIENEIRQKLQKISKEKDQQSTLEKSSPNVKRNIFAFLAEQSSSSAFKKEKTIKKKDLLDLKLEATFTGQTPIAVINNQTLLVGQNIQDYQLKEVHEGQVVLMKDKQTFTLSIKEIKQEEINQPIEEVKQEKTKSIEEEKNDGME
ncbi:MAG: hypothetical protein JXA79_10910 [Deltaproteobacteria bacterium]|nr:hypothetical protein [Deltaproteobacteria bacterium]